MVNEMKKENMTLINIDRQLSRAEMKQLMAGSDPVEEGGSCAGPHEYCSTPNGITCCNPHVYVCASNSCQPFTN